ncbi:hypothetical protein [Sphingomonas sanxanigenens]|uniref:J domain-containing protein n=1 Tax=Sphingomonas sanxanigenens DSM 19645 = NX02 TaxID=1123269 RepID=W0AI66_9SPHN|nr:hypothetical protein [Sphingomonas sanxanigenens]AHE56247.1 hypothetical protein NX02_23155 [Sphingomonas sanxanigenens DSM 19645 = NX02]
MAKLLFLGLLIVAVWLAVRPRPKRVRPPRPPAHGEDMGIDEARRLLDLPAGADAAMIRAAHRRIIARVHPDAGGTEELARRTNLARDLLLRAATSDSPPRA